MQTYYQCRLIHGSNKLASRSWNAFRCKKDEKYHSNRCNVFQPTHAFEEIFLKRNTHLRRGKNELIFESIDIYIPFAQDDISKPRPEVSCREANIKHGTTLMPCKFRDILAIRAIIDADQRYGLNKRTRDPPFPQGIDNSRLFISFCPESAAFVLCDRKRRIGARIELDITLHMLECSVPLLTRGRK